MSLIPKMIKNQKMYKLSLLICLTVFLNNLGLAQHTEKTSKDSSSIAQILRKGKFEGFSRSFLMGTINEAKLKDFVSLGTNLGGYYVSPVWKGFQIKFGGSFVFNLAGTDLTKVDSLTGKPSRYEIGLYDLQNPERRWDLGKMEQILIKYHFRKSSVTLGRQLLNTPFINPQDGRIRPTFEEGIWFEINELKKLQFQSGYIWGISPRSIIGWYNVGESIGFYPEGRNPDGKPSGYVGNTKSAGVLLASARYKTIAKKSGSEFDIQIWEQLVINLSNSIFLQGDWSKKLNGQGLKLKIGLQGIYQNPLGQGGNPNDSMRFFPLDQQTWIIGAQTALESKKWSAELNYNRIFGTGRFLSPREWGREPLYTFLPRERLEGAGNVHAFSLNLIYKIPKSGLLFRLSYAHNLLPDVKESLLNKYAMPSFGHAQCWIEKKFGKKAEGLSIKMLYLYKLALSDTYNNPNFIYNKANMHHMDFILDFKF
jgi:hypothetical protein